jgi:hypothetical protein
MPAPAYKPDAKDTAADTPRSDDSWYRAFATAAEGAAAQRAASSAPTTTPSTGQTIPDPLDTLTLSDIPGPHRRRSTDNAGSPVQVQQQQAELERLIEDNKRLMDRIETLLQIQGREQVLRQQLQNQVEHIGERMKLSPPVETLEAVRREARAGVTEEIKPVLMAILDALERFTGNPESKAAPAEIVELTDDPYRGEDYGKLPLILTRPIGELMDDYNDPGRSNSGSSSNRRRKYLFHSRKHARPQSPAEHENASGAGPFTWTTVSKS